MIYLDNAATTPITDEVVTAMTPYYSLLFGNPESSHEAGAKVREAVFTARMELAKFFGDNRQQHIVFTSGGTEANNLAILGIRQYLDAFNRKHLITSTAEHKSVKNVFLQLRDEGFHVTFLSPGSKGYISAAQVKEAIRDDTGLVSVMYVNNETGCVNDIQEIGELCHSYYNKIFFHVDCVQAAGYFDLDYKNLNCDSMSVSAHKIHGPKGIGCLWVKEPGLYDPIMRGGFQEWTLRPGTLNVPGIVGFGTAAKLSSEKQIESHFTIRDNWIALHDALSEIPGVHYNFCDDKGHYCRRISSVRFDDVDGETLAAALDIRGICVSTGAACNSQSSEPSYVLMESGLSAQEAGSTIRISISSQTTKEQILEAAGMIEDTVSFLRSRAVEEGE